MKKVVWGLAVWLALFVAVVGVSACASPEPSGRGLWKLIR